MPGDAVPIEPGSVLLVRGPATVEALTEGVEILGVKPRQWEKVGVRKNKVIPVEAEERALVLVELKGAESGYWFASEGAGVRIWSRVADRVFSSITEKPFSLMIVGGTDTGKSTLAVYLANVALSRGLRAAVLDCDVGQSDMGPPGCMSAGFVTWRAFDLRDMVADHYEFLGITSPRGFLEQVIDGMKSLESLVSKNTDIIIVNTDGYVRQGGAEYKVKAARALNPNAILCFRGEEGDLLRVLSEALPGKVIEVEKTSAGVKSHSVRLERRLNQYKRFLKEGRFTRVSLADARICFLRTVYDKNIEVGGYRLRKLSESGWTLTVRSRETPSIVIDREKKEVDVNSYALSGMFVALEVKGKVKGFGMIEGVDPSLTANILTSAGWRADTIHLSTVRLSPKFDDEILIPLLII